MLEQLAQAALTTIYALAVSAELPNEVGGAFA
jgi:hypothetical protein